METLEPWLTPLILPDFLAPPRQYYDPFFTTLFIAPALWCLLFRPLRRFAIDEKNKYEALKSQVVEAVVTIDLNGVVISFNPAAEKIFGYSPEEINGKYAAELFSDEYLSVSNLEEIVKEKDSELLLIHELTSRTKRGNELRLEISVSRLMVAGTPQFLVIMRDITRRTVMEREARLVQSRLIQINKMTALGLMVSGVAHEVNNPNNYILLNAQLLERSCGDLIKILREYHRDNGDFAAGGLSFEEIEKNFPEMISGIIDGAQRINGIINELKDFYRDWAVSSFVEIDVNPAVSAAISIIRTQIARHTSNFRFISGEDLPRVSGNSHQLGQVVINLLMNACQSLRNESEAVTVETFYDSSTSEVVISVSDEGAGIPEDIALLVKESFFSTRTDNGGTGLGLSISDAIVKEHKGTLTFKSQPGHGTVFQVRLPVAMQQYAEAR